MILIKYDHSELNILLNKYDHSKIIASQPNTGLMSVSFPPQQWRESEQTHGSSVTSQPVYKNLRYCTQI